MLIVFFLFHLEEARNASLPAHNRKRRANDGSFSHDNDDDDDENSGNYPDDYDDEEFHDPAKKDPRFLKSEKIAVHMAERNESFLSTMGHRFEDMVLSCTYRGVPCR